MKSKYTITILTLIVLAAIVLFIYDLRNPKGPGKEVNSQSPQADSNQTTVQSLQISYIMPTQIAQSETSNWKKTTNSEFQTSQYITNCRTKK